MNGKNPYSESEPCNPRNPGGKSEPAKARNPSLRSEPATIRNPQGESEPTVGRNPLTESEPASERNPCGESEPSILRNPFSGSDLDEETKERIKQLVNIYYDVQDVRIRSFNRLRTVGHVEGVNPEHLKKLEKEIREYIEKQIEDIPIYRDFLKHIYGIGTILSGALLSYLDPKKADHPSSFWRYMGLHVRDGKAIKLEHGKRIDFNKKLRPFYWKIGMQFIRFKTPIYFNIYENARKQEIEKLGNPLKNPHNCPHYNECIARLQAKSKRMNKPSKNPPCKLHIHLRAMRKAVKRFLSDLWLKWREIENLPISQPYAIAKLGHTPDQYTLKL
jgi:hypothetical protein